MAQVQSSSQQQQYDMIVAGAIKKIFSPQLYPVIIAKLAHNRGQVAPEIGHTAAMIMSSIKASAEKQNQQDQVPPTLLFAASREIVTSLCKIALGMKLITPDHMQQVAATALKIALQAFTQSQQQSGGIGSKIQGAQQNLPPPGVPQGGAQPPGPPGMPAGPQGQPMGMAPAGPPGIVNQATQPPGAQ